MGERSLLLIGPAELATTDRKGINDSFPLELMIWSVSETSHSHLQPTINLTRMDTIQSKMTFGVVDKRPLLYIIPADLSATKRTTLNDSLAIEITDLVGFKNDLLPPTIKFNEPDQFLKVLTS